MRISVVIPTYNSASLVVEAVESVLAQTSPVHEILVVDDGSRDDTSERLAGYGLPVRYLHKENGGVSTARNFGVQSASGDWIAFLDADDIWHPRKIEYQVLELSAKPDLLLLGTRFFDWPGTMPHWDHNPVVKSTVLDPDEFLIRNALGTSSLLVRRETLLAGGLFDTTLKGPEDYDLWLRISDMGPMAILDLPLSGYRVIPGSLSRNAERMELDQGKILAKLDRTGRFKGRSLIRRKAWANYRYSSALTYREAGNHWTALNRAIRSIGSWPLHLYRYPDEQFIERYQFLAVTFFHALFKRTHK